jgi:asparagine synthase (glutamine-hydrolysing)
VVPVLAHARPVGAGPVGRPIPLLAAVGQAGVRSIVSRIADAQGEAEHRHLAGGLQTFSVRFTDPDYDEGSFQRTTAAFLKTRHREVTCSYRDIGRVMPSVVWHAEKPLVRTAPAPLYLLSGLVHDAGIKVVLSGEGADELLGGYDLFRETKIRRFWARNPGSAWRGALLRRLYSYAANWQRITPAYLRAFYKAYLSGADGSFFSHLPRWDTTAGIKSYFSDALKSELASGDCVRDLEALLPAGFPGWSHLSRAQYIETATLLSGNLLSSQGDRMAMAHSVEGRYPFLDHRVAEFCAALPERLRLKVLAEKYLLKKIARHPVVDLNCAEAELEETFLAYYGTGEHDAA